MDEFETYETAEIPQGSARSPRWTGAASIALAQQLNEQCVELLCELAITSSSQDLPQFILQNRDQWRLLEFDARKRVAAFPFVIVDLCFKDVESWQRAADRHSMSGTDSPLFIGVPPKLCEDPIPETLLFARQTAREDVNVAKAMFAMTSPVARLIVLLTLPQIRAVAASNTRLLRVRWDSDSEFWGDLLVACRRSDERAMAALRRQGKQLFCGELIGSHVRASAV
jgi:hypothetical protein